MAASMPQRCGQYLKHEQIGQGTFGVVHKVTKESDVNPGGQVQCFAMKKVAFAENQDSRERELVSREEEILKSVKHDNVVRYVDSFREGNCVYLIMELCLGGTLYSYIRSLETKLSEDEFVKFLRQIVTGLKFLHRKGVLHRDIKTKNILMTKDLILKISDFGVSRITDYVNPSNHSIKMGTPRYMSPEVLNGEEYGQKTDIWSLGCTAYEMAEMHFAFSADRQKEAVSDIMKYKLPNFDGINYCSDMIYLMKSMLNKNPAKRPSAKHLLKSLSDHECSTAEGDDTTQYYLVEAAGRASALKTFEKPRKSLELASTEIQKLLVMELNSNKAVDIVSSMKKSFRDGKANHNMLNTLNQSDTISLLMHLQSKYEDTIKSDRLEIFRRLGKALMGTTHALSALEEAMENSGSNDDTD
ncbi:serine/threonine-protein kinase Nek4-like [Ylistrum balloti]|uniref:serine/threonine-protein kinase Nek4-like n=1 Tax=Ylistrum balloti TaxID=509963 RepID=UPI00290587E7|nr:serine/threonine-protein kinase Nek4-like [Ylistrum balloti]